MEQRRTSSHLIDPHFNRGVQLTLTSWVDEYYQQYIVSKLILEFFRGGVGCDVFCALTPVKIKYIVGHSADSKIVSQLNRLPIPHSTGLRDASLLSGCRLSRFTVTP